MARKPKVVEDEAESVVEEAVELVSVRAHQNFRDGAFKNDFDALGYKLLWKEGEVRSIPPRLYFKLQQRSGNQFSLVGDSNG